MERTEQTARGRLHATCPDCGDDSGSMDRSECEVVAAPDGGEPQVRIAWECLACGALFDGWYGMLDTDYRLTDHGHRADDETDQVDAELGRINRLAGR